MWAEASRGRGCGAALERALLVLEWKVRNTSNSPTIPIYDLCHPRCIVAMKTLRFCSFCSVLTPSNVLKIKAVFHPP